MAGNAAAAAQIGEIILRDYLENRNESAYCRYVEFVDDGPGGWNPAVGFARQRFCDFPPPPPPDTSDFFNAGGVPCRLYRVTYATGSPGSALTNTVVDRRGPIGLVFQSDRDTSGNPRKRFYLSSGDGGACSRLVEIIASSSNTNVTDITARIVSIVPLEGDPETEVPVWRPPLQPPNPPTPDFEFDIEFNVDGVDVNEPFTFGPIINTPQGPTIQVNFQPTANFNPQIDVDLGINPSFGLDVDLEFIVPLGGTPTNPVPIQNVPPVDLPPVTLPGQGECEEFDYERIEDFITASRCCKPITDVLNVGTFTFETSNDVAFFSLPNNTVAVFLGIVPGNNTRAYKFAGADSEYGHGNASLMVRGNALGFERLYVNNHALFFPEESVTKGVRISCAKGTIVTVNAGLFVPVVEMGDA